MYGRFQLGEFYSHLGCSFGVVENECFIRFHGRAFCCSPDVLEDEWCDVFAGDFSLGGSFDSSGDYGMHCETRYVVFLGDGIAKELAVLKAQHVARDCGPR